MIDENQHEVDQIDEKLNKASSLQNEFDRWAGNWFGGKKRAAQREAKQEIENRRIEKEEGAQLHEVYEHAKYGNTSPLFFSFVSMYPFPFLEICFDTCIIYH